MDTPLPHAFSSNIANVLVISAVWKYRSIHH